MARSNYTKDPILEACEAAIPVQRKRSAVPECLSLDMRAGQDGNAGKVQFREIPGPAYVSADVPGRGIRPRNAFALKNGVGAVSNIGPIKNATAFGETAPCLPYMSLCNPCCHDALLSSRACAVLCQCGALAI